jgi:ABC-type transport system involved in multi-copper enzyme maturation permease subunit
MLRRELAIVLRSRITWLAAALSALLVGHGFVLAVDLFTAGSRSALANTLMSREFDPLLGIVRPTLGGLYLSVSLLSPLVAARAIAVEKERRSFAPLLLQTAAPLRLVAAKALAALCGVSLLFAAPLLLLLLWVVSGGHLAVAETLVALKAHGLYLALVVGLSVAASAWVATLAQAALLAMLLVAASWAIDASEGFAALAWLGRAVDWSVTTHLYPMERGTLALGAVLWFLVLIAGTLVIAWLGARFDLPAARRRSALLVAVAATLAAGSIAHRVRRVIDVTELRRASLPPAAAIALGRLPGPIRLEVWLDRDDARRRQLESDTLAKLRIARPDLEVRMVLDDRAAPAEGERVEGYGRIVVEAGGGRRETFSTSRKELTTLIFEAAGQSLPDWSQPEYPGHPLVIEGTRRAAVLFAAYAGIPLGLLAAGWHVTRSRRRIP